MKKWNYLIPLLTILSTIALGVTVKQSVSLTSFNAGELSPLMHSRVDFDKYKTGAKTLQNMLVRAQGPVTRRPGTKYIATVKDATDSVRIIPFEYSTDDAYIIELGDAYARFYRTVDGVGGPILGTYAAWTTTTAYLQGALVTNAGSYYRCLVAHTSGTFSTDLSAAYWVESGGSTDVAYEIVTPWDSNDLFELQFVQDAETMRFAHPDYEPYKLTRTGHTAWTCVAIGSTTGPFLDENSDSSWTLKPSATTGDGIDIVSTDPLFNKSDHEGALWRISHWLEGDSTIKGYFRAEGSVQSSATNKCQRWRYFDVTTGGIWRGTIYVQKTYETVTRWATKTSYVIGDYVTADPDSRSTYRCLTTHTSGTFSTDLAADKWVEDVTIWKSIFSQYVQYGGNIQFTYQETEDDCYIRIFIDNLAIQYSNDDLGWCHYTIFLREFLNNGVVEIATVTDACNVTANVLYDLGSTDATWYWSEGAWSTYRGFPRTIEHHEQRVIYGGSKSYPQTIWSSIIITSDDDYDDFTASTESDWSGNLGGPDDVAWTYTLPGMNPIQWMKSAEYLMIGTTSGVGKLGQPDKPITPNYPPTYRVQNHNGCAYMQPKGAVDAMLYVERGSQKVRELAFAYANDKYVAPDMTILSEDITGNGITQIAFQNRPDPILWCVREDGVLLSFTYHRKHDVMAWSRQVTDGEYDSFAKMPGDTEDELWVVVDRDVGTYIEKFAPFNWGTDQNDCYFVDSGVDDITNLSHLEGGTVALFADGRPIGTYTVASNIISPAGSYTYTTVGLPYTSIFETVPLIVYTSSGNSLGKNTAVLELKADFLKTLGCHIGTSSTYNADIKFSDDSFATTVDVFTGIKKIPFARGESLSPTIYLTESDPVPLTLRGYNVDLEATFD